MKFVEWNSCTSAPILQENALFFGKNLHSWHKFYTTASRESRDQSQLCQQALHPKSNVAGICISLCVCISICIILYSYLCFPPPLPQTCFASQVKCCQYLRGSSFYEIAEMLEARNLRQFSAIRALWIPPKSDDVIYEQPLIDPMCLKNGKPENLNILPARKAFVLIVVLHLSGSLVL